MKKFICFFIAIFQFSVCVYSQNDDLLISELEFKDAKLMDVIRVISELSGDNIVATPEAAQKNVSVYLRGVSTKHALETICRINDLWFRKDNANTYRVMTSDEYSKDLVIHRDDFTRVFVVRAPNVEAIGEAIENLYGQRVELTESGEPSRINQGGLSGSNNNSNNSGRQTAFNQSSSMSMMKQENKSIDQDLSVDQIAALGTEGESRNIVSAEQLLTLSTQREPIFVTMIAEHNIIAVRTGDKETLDQIEKLVNKIDKPVPQVLLEMKVMDVLLGDDFSSVFNYAFNDPNSDDSVSLGNNATIGGSFIYQFVNDKLTANIEFLEENKRINVLSTPIVMAANNRAAKLFVGDELVIVKGYTKTSLSAGGGSNLTVVNNSSTIVPVTSIEEVGNTIEIEPYINSDGTITMKLKQQISSLKSNASTVGVVQDDNILSLPIDSISTASLEGTVIAKDGLTFAVGGLIRENISEQTSRVPFLSSIPLLGRIFSSVQDKKTRSELILMITPRIMSDPAIESGPTDFVTSNIIDDGLDDYKRLNVFSTIRCRENCLN
tara:strand:- start:2279 stop:3931 length:1653 start_codon:yes stop_codon:yes gene_type:complete